MPKKPKPPGLESIEEADGALRLLGEAKGTIARLALAAQRGINKIKADLTEALVEPKAIVQATTKLLERFLETHRDQVVSDDKKSVDLKFGRLGYRDVPASLVWLKGWTESDVIAAIKRRYPDPIDQANYIETRESVRKDNVKSDLDEEQLARIGCALSDGENWVIEPAADVPEAAVSKDVA